MIRMTNPVTGHQISTEDDSVEFWSASGYRQDEKPKTAPKKAAAKKSSSTKK